MNYRVQNTLTMLALVALFVSECAAEGRRAARDPFSARWQYWVVARNVEVKARVADLSEVEARARLVATEGPVDIAQDDTFFACSRGRLKVREFTDGRGELIHYLRDDESGPKISDYLISPISSPEVLRESLSRAFGVIGRVRKHRRLYLVDRTRIHLDAVDGLGHFVELEVVLSDGESLEAGTSVARSIHGGLGHRSGPVGGGRVYGHAAIGAHDAFELMKVVA